MNANELKAIFNKVIEQQQDKEAAAKLEVVREYFTNPEFKAALQQYLFEKTYTQN